MTNKYPRFAALLRRRMETQRLTVRALSRAIGSNYGTLVQWRNGYRLPTDHFLGRLADILDAPILVIVAGEYRDGECRECGKLFRQHEKAGKTQVFCGPACKSTWSNRKQRERTRSTRADRIAIAKQRERSALAKAEQARVERTEICRAVAAFCRSCEWDGICKMAECELRAYSPFPLSVESVA